MARRLAAGKISPNTISVVGMAAATVGAGGMACAGWPLPWAIGMVIGVCGAQIRLLCNLMDGMVAVEGGMKGRGGDFLNEAPDRYSDIVLLVGAGLAVSEPWLGWMAACGAVLTAYVRAFGASLDGRHDFSGMMTKPRRMFFLCVGALGAIISPACLVWALWGIGVGSFATAGRRCISIWERTAGPAGSGGTGEGGEALREFAARVIRIVTGIPQLPSGALPGSTAVFYSNHSSHLDFLAIWAALPTEARKSVRPVAGRDYWESGAVRKYLAGNVFNALLIERKDVGRSSNPLPAMVGALERGESLIVFPEGTRSIDGTVGEFKSGIFHLARSKPEVPMVPVFLQNMFRILPKGGLLPLPVIGGIKVGESVFLGEGERKCDFLARTRGELVRLDS